MASILICIQASVSLDNNSPEDLSYKEEKYICLHMNKGSNINCWPKEFGKNHIRSKGVLRWKKWEDCAIKMKFGWRYDNSKMDLVRGYEVAVAPPSSMVVPPPWCNKKTLIGMLILQQLIELWFLWQMWDS